VTSPEGPADALERRYTRWREWLNQYKASNSFTWAKIARELGTYAESSLSLFAHAKYPVENSSQLLDTIERYARLVEARRAAIAQPGFVMTSIARTINSLIWETQLLGRIGIIAGESGIGKSQAIRYHAADTPNAAYVVLHSYVSTAHALLPKMLAAIGRPEPRRVPPYVAYDRLVEFTKGTSWFFLIDEAHHLQSKTLDMLRCYQEEAGVALILGGNTELFQNAQWIDRIQQPSAAFTQFESRCAVRAHLTAADVKRGDVLAIAQQVVGVELTNACADMLLTQARNAVGGSIRTVVTVLQKAQAAHHRDPSKPLTREDIEAVIERHMNRGSRRAA
jgi:DNA transposition AAA+ family ATPase